MERRSFALLAVGVGLLVGLLGNIFFYNRLIGLSFPIFITIVVIVILALARPAGRVLNRRNLWPLLPLLFFAAMVAVRADWMVLLLNLAAVLTLGALGLHYLVLERSLDEDPLEVQAGAVFATGLMILPSALVETGHSWAWLRENRHQRGGQFASVIRGSAFALPVVLVFAFLLGSADAVFANYVSQAWNGVLTIFGLNLMGETVNRAFITLAFAGATTGALSYALARRLPIPTTSLDTDDLDSPSLRSGEGAGGRGLENEKRKPAFKLAMIESTIILGSVVGLFAAFVVIQFAYFFGGHANINVSGLTYAEYARRGFFELVAVSGLTLGLALGLDRVTVRQEGRETKLFRVLSVILVVLTTVMLISASQRMWLYEEAFGFTQLRVYVHIAILWLGVLFGVFLLALFRLKKNVFSFGLVVVSIGYLVSLNLLNVDHYIAERNIARYHAGQELDIAFLNILSVDAVPVILPLYVESEPGSGVNDWAGQWLARHLHQLDGERTPNGTSVLSWNASRAAAYDQLSAIRDTLPTYDPYAYGRGDWWSFDPTYGELNNYTSGWDSVTITPVR
jgi:hypothetical protein